jgi:hypothetical protein
MMEKEEEIELIAKLESYVDVAPQFKKKNSIIFLFLQDFDLDK